MTEWKRVRLRDVMALDLDPVTLDRDTTYPIVGVLNRGRGLLHRDPILGADTQYKTLNRIQPEKVVFSRLKAFEGAITVTDGHLGEAYASQEFPTFTCKPDLLPAFFRLITTTPSLWAGLQNLSTGMGGRRERVKPDAFLTIEIGLPPLSEQRRIVDVMEAVDRYIEALGANTDAARLAADSAAESLLSDVTRGPLSGVLTDIEGGRSPVTAGETPNSDERGVLKVSAVTPGRFIPSEAKALPPETSLPAHTEVRAGDVLITRANTPQRVGAVCRVPDSVRSGLFLCDKTLRLALTAEADPDFIVVAMGLRTARAHLSETATGTSASMVNVSQTKIRSTPIPLPPVPVQREVAGIVNSLVATAEALEGEQVALREFRATLLENLLAQRVVIPLAYDALLLGAA